MPPLAVPGAGGDPAAVEASPAGRLFVERARAARPGWQLGGPEAEAVARICQRLDGLPLALELAASRLRALSAAAIADRLDDGLAVLGRGTLDASIEASHALLAPGRAGAVPAAGRVPRRFGLEDAEHVGGGDGLPQEHVLDLLVALTEHSMVQAEGDAPRRYRMLEALRAERGRGWTTKRRRRRHGGTPPTWRAWRRRPRRASARRAPRRPATRSSAGVPTWRRPSAGRSTAATPTWRSSWRRASQRCIIGSAP